jgi:ferritin-like metal-binding protein YciE
LGEWLNLHCPEFEALRQLSGTGLAALPADKTFYGQEACMEQKQLKELLLQSLEHERGGIKVYETALKCAVNEDLKEEWEKYHQETEHHVEVLQDVFSQMQLDAEEQSPGRKIVHDMGASLVAAMEAALGAGNKDAAQLVACECVTLAETKDHLNWELIGEASKKLSGAEAKALKEAYEEVEDQDDEHLYHTRGWCRELWMESLGMKAILPPPEERKHVKTAIGAARAEKERKTMR